MLMQNEQRFKVLGASTTDVLTNLKFGKNNDLCLIINLMEL